MRVRRLAALLCAATIFSCFAGCGAGTPRESEPDTVSTSVATEQTTAPGFVPTGNVNPLTGLCDGISDAALGRRPVAIMVSNSYNSLPQWGVSQADIIYEMLAEGRITRFLCLFQDPSKIEALASIRSARPYFIDIAQGYGAVYLHFGGSVPAYEAIASRKDLLSIDGIRGNWEGTLFERDPERRKTIGLEHSVYTTGEKIEAALPKLNADLALSGAPSAFTFGEQSSAENGTPANRIELTFSDRHKPYFTYDAERGTYLRFQYGDPQMDAKQQKQIEVRNLLVLRMDTVDIPDNALHIIDVDATGAGTGYYFCGGKMAEITWKKDSYAAPIAFFHADGTELIAARGQSFISCITKTATVDVDGTKYE